MNAKGLEYTANAIDGTVREPCKGGAEYRDTEVAML